MDADVDPSAAGPVDGVPEGREGVAPVDEFEGAVVGGLKAVLDGDEGVPVQFGKEVQRFLVGAVRPRADGEADDFRDVQGLLVTAAQRFHGPVSVREGLEVGDEFLRLVPLFKAAFPFSSCSRTERDEKAPVPEPRALQYIHPPVPTFPSRLGQVKPASRLTFWMRQPKRSLMALPRSLYGKLDMALRGYIIKKPRYRTVSFWLHPLELSTRKFD